MILYHLDLATTPSMTQVGHYTQANMRLRSCCFVPVIAGVIGAQPITNPPSTHDQAATPNKGVHGIGAWIQDHPAETACISIGMSLACGAFLIPPILGAVGFGAGGVGATTSAAGIHSSIGAVVAGSSFAWAQSVGAGGTAAVGLSMAGYAGLGSLDSALLLPAFVITTGAGGSTLLGKTSSEK